MLTRDNAQVVALVGLWWASSAAFSVATKKALRLPADDPAQLQVVIFVTALQLVGAALFSVALLAVRGDFSQSLRTTRLCLRIGMLHCLGNHMTNLLVVISGVSGALTYKAGEPVFVVVALRLFAVERYHKELTIHRLWYLVMICVGVIISSYHPPFMPLLAIVGVVCNFSFGTRTVFIKKLRDERMDDDGPSMLEIFLATSMVACTIMSCVALVTGMVSDLEKTKIAVSTALSAPALQSSLYYFVYNLVSFLALDRVSTSSHALLKTGKTLTVLMVAGLFLGETYSGQEWFGLYLAMLGATLFAHAPQTRVENRVKYAKELAQRAGMLAAMLLAAFTLGQGLSGLTLDFSFAAPPVSVSLLDRVNASGRSAYLTAYEDHGNAAAWLTCLEAVQQSQYEILRDVFEDPKVRANRVLFLDPSHHENFGDTALSQGSFQMLGRMGFGSSSITQCWLNQAWRSIVKPCEAIDLKDHYLAVFQPGGNWGDLWRENQKRRQEIFEVLIQRNMTLLGLPQSYKYYHKDIEKQDADQLKGFIEKYIGLQHAKEKIIFTWRSQQSFDMASKALPFVQHRLVPDMAFALRPMMPRLGTPVSTAESVDILFIWRIDKEGRFQDLRKSEWVQSELVKLGAGEVTFRIADWFGLQKVFPQGAEGHRSTAANGFDYEMFFSMATELISLGKVIITDRLHGSIISLLHRKPHIALDNSYRKVTTTRAAAFASHPACRDQDALSYRYSESMTEAISLAVHFVRHNVFPQSSSSWET